ncbi:MAG: hypothetical protein ACYTG0_24360 [Planctomycetota bacterium]
MRGIYYPLVDPGSHPRDSERSGGGSAPRLFQRGYFSGVVGGEEEPLPNVLPLESRLGVRLHQPCPVPRWSMELSARVVNDQDRVARSLLETPTPGFTVWASTESTSTSAPKTALPFPSLG